MKICLLVITMCLMLQIAKGQSQTLDSTINKHVAFKPEALIIPTGLLTYGILGVKNDPIKRWNVDIREKFNPDRRISNIDDFLVVSPVATVYGLDLMGVEPKNNFLDRTVVLGTASAIVISAVVVTKRNVTARRPVGKSKASFPSGHTSMAFMSAEFMNQELKHLSPWYGIAAYGIAGFTGYMRLYNDKHFFSEVVAGAGIGILGTKIAYWLQPTIQNTIFKQRNREQNSTQQVFLAPSYNGSEMVLAASWTF